MHDAGKLAVQRAILDKPQKLSSAEFAVIQRHPLITMQIRQMIDDVAFLAEWAELHHERYDGTGYPFDLQGQQIPLAACIMSIADAFDAITSRRPYQPRRSAAEGVRIIMDLSGAQFDPEVAEAAASVLPEVYRQIYSTEGVS